MSQSKVTGILVEEALNYRGLLNSSLYGRSTDIDCKARGTEINTNDIFNIYFHAERDNHNLLNNEQEDEIQMINDFIEFKFFKNIINKKRKNI